jgi:hypothetical protein
MSKPKEGDRVTVLDRLSSFGDENAPKEWIVLAVFDNLEEDWGSFGESAWAQKEHDIWTAGKSGEWYVVCATINPLDGTCSFASYEVTVVQG